MKKLSCLLLALLLLFSCALAESSYRGSLFTLRWADGAYQIDTTTYRGQSRNGYEWLFMLYNDRAMVDVSLMASPDVLEAHVGEPLTANGTFAAAGLSFSLYSLRDGVCAAAPLGQKLLCFELYEVAPGGSAMSLLTSLLSGLSLP